MSDKKLDTKEMSPHKEEPLKLPPPKRKPPEDEARDKDKAKGEEEKALNKRRSREASQQAKEEEEELTNTAFVLKLIVDREGKLNDLEVKLLELFFSQQGKFQKRMTNLYIEQRRFSYMQNETLVTMNDIVKGALTSNVDLVNKYGELKSASNPNKAEETLQLINGILSIPALAALQQAGVDYLTKGKGINPALLPPQQAQPAPGQILTQPNEAPPTEDEDQ